MRINSRLSECGTMLRCRICKEFKFFDEFYKDKILKYDRSNACKICKLKLENERYKTGNAHNNLLKRRYNIDISIFNEMYNRQNGFCGICSLPFGNNTAHVDHDHNSGKVRLLLCSNCNTGKGYFKDNINIISEAINYLEFYNKNPSNIDYFSLLYKGSGSRTKLGKQYELMLFDLQDSRCSICNIENNVELINYYKKSYKIRLQIDHCHSTNFVRGLLCTNCNAGLGRFNDSIEPLQACQQDILMHE